MIQVVLMNTPCTFRILPPKLRSIGLSLLNRTSFVNAVLADSTLKEQLLAAFMNELIRECDHLCGKKNLVSIQRKSKADDCYNSHGKCCNQSGKKKHQCCITSLMQ